ncbi:MAG: sensor histidine kinase [Bacillota bacterium]
MRKYIERLLDRTYNRRHISSVILLSFTVTATVSLAMFSVTYYERFGEQVAKLQEEENINALAQIEGHFTQRIRAVMQVFDALYYTILYEKPIEELDFDLLYLSMNNEIQSISLFDKNGVVQMTAPTMKQNENVDVLQQDWFLDAISEVKNKQFSEPHIQNIFVNADTTYEWVVSLSQSVNFQKDGIEHEGVLVIDMKYVALEDYITKMGFNDNGIVYLTDSKGELIYHPEIQLISSGIFDFSEETYAGYQKVTRSVPFLGWTIVGVIEQDRLDLDVVKDNIFFVYLLFLFFAAMLIINLLISVKIAKPIVSMEVAVKNIASGDLDTKLPNSGFLEILNLKKSIETMKERIEKLMEDSISKQEELRKQELDVLQSQINPHFLYNTLDIIVWLIEKKDFQNASDVVTALGRFFRIGLSRGKKEIPIRDELDHVQNYLDIQMVRYKNKFTYRMEIDEAVFDYQIVKLILQPLVENAIYHAMEFMYGDGEILITAKLHEDHILFTVEDNGIGIDSETIALIESGQVVPSPRGSGIGTINVLNRLQMMYGMAYGIFYDSDLEEGTKVYVKIPRVEGAENNE